MWLPFKNYTFITNTKQKTEYKKWETHIINNFPILVLIYNEKNNGISGWNNHFDMELT